MLAPRKIAGLARALFVLMFMWPAAAQNAASPPPSAAPESATNSARKGVTFDEFVDSAIQQEHRLTQLMRFYKPIVETYIQQEQRDSELQTSPKNDDYFLSRLDLTGDAPANREFENPERVPEEKKGPKNAPAFAAVGFAQSVFPDLNHFDRQNYEFEFVRWEVLGDIRCVAIDVHPRQNSKNRGFVGRVWVEDQDYNIVRFTGTYTSNAYSKRAFHFESWRLNLIGTMWMPAYVYTEESDAHDSSSGLWFKAQTRIWGYDLQQAGDHHENTKPLTDNPAGVDPNRHEASQDLSPNLTVGKATYTPEDEVVERLQVGGLMAPDGDVDRILETVVNNILVTNDLDIAGLRCRVLLTTPLESFVIGRTIVVSRGLLDVLPDEATLAAVLAHEVAHVVLRHPLAVPYSSETSLPFSDQQIFAKLEFHFDPAKEAEADKKGQELFSKSPYKDKVTDVAIFLQAVNARSPQLPNLFHGRFSNDFGSSHLVAMEALANSPKRLKMDQPDQIAALPLGSRIKMDPWADRIEMQKSKSPPPASAAEKMPFEVSPFFPHLKRLEETKP